MSFQKNIALIFAGGVGSRMNLNSTPKQFLELNGKPIIIYTLEIFQRNNRVDGIVISVLDGWLDFMRDLVFKYKLDKVVDIIVGGSTGQLSIYNGLEAIEKKFNSNSIVLIHDGVRPLINDEIINNNIDQVKKGIGVITTSPTVETFVIVDDSMIVDKVPPRSYSRLAKAPQSFILNDIISVHRMAISDGILDSIDSCSLMYKYGKPLKLIEGCVENIKITTPTDFFIFKAIVELRENEMILGVR